MVRSKVTAISRLYTQVVTSVSMRKARATCIYRIDDEASEVCTVVVQKPNGVLNAT